MKNNVIHNFHIPVMGIGFTIDTPLRVAQYGISSAISLGDDGLLEKLRKFYCDQSGRPYQPIPDQAEDCRAKRIKSYLNLIDKLAKEKFEELKKSVFEETGAFRKYMDLLPDFSLLKRQFTSFAACENLQEIREWLWGNLAMGAIDVNIMTKVDRVNFRKGKPLPIEYNDAHAAIRGFAESNLESSLILSAGMNPRLYGYLGNFDDFFPDENRAFKKKITLKVSDYRSALIQGKFLAKKGLWVSEYRIESGLNCGGHAFPADGLLLGPVLEEFKTKRLVLTQTIFELYREALKKMEKVFPGTVPSVKFTAQGGVGTAGEHQFLLDHYGLDSIGWGTPFLLVPEVTNVDADTLQLLKSATEDDLYLSDISPLGVRFNSIRRNTKELEKQQWINKGRPGSSCPKKYLAFNTEFSEKGICVASREYQHLKIKELENQKLDDLDFAKKYAGIVNKTCLCVGLGASALLVNNLDTKVEGRSVSVCPGPNLAYFSRTSSLQEMVDHIYGRMNLIERKDRPNLFIKELKLNILFFREKLAEIPAPATEGQMKDLIAFHKNMTEGISYYNDLVAEFSEEVDDGLRGMLDELNMLSIELETLSAGLANKVSG